MGNVHTYMEMRILYLCVYINISLFLCVCVCGTPYICIHPGLFAPSRDSKRWRKPPTYAGKKKNKQCSVKGGGGGKGNDVIF